jgi:prepilin-type N-terminal cleavage/methylation domain-containing protein
MNQVEARKPSGPGAAAEATRMGTAAWSRRCSAPAVRRDGRGMTAVELVIVLAIVAILGFAAYPLLSNVRQVMLVKGAAEQVAGAIRLARQFAITEGTNYCIEFRTSPSTQYQIRQADTTPACNGTIVDGYAWTDLAQSNNGSVTTTAPTVAFDPIGNRILPSGTSNSAFTVDAVPTSCISTITVTIYGGVRVAAC